MVCVRMPPDKTVALEGRVLTSLYTVDAFKLTTCPFFGVSQKEAGLSLACKEHQAFTLRMCDPVDS